MTDALAWLEQHTEGAPEQLRRRMTEAVAGSNDQPLHLSLAAAAFSCLQAALQDPKAPDAALHLLSADALLTHACAAGPPDFAESLNAARFQQLLEYRA
jgi:hypothetical protein